MRKLIATAVSILFLTLAGKVSAQQFTSSIGPPPKSSVFSTTGTSSTFFGQAMAKPAYSSMMTRPAMPAPLSLSNMLPTFPNLQNMMLLRNVFGPGTSVQMPRHATTPPRK